MFDPFAKQSEKVTRPDFSPAGDGDESYRWKGQEYTRVTTVLNVKPQNDRLQAWACRLACFATLEPFHNAGLLPNFEPDDKFLEWIEGRSIQPRTTEEAMLAMVDYSHNLREAFRYRDHKARVGRLVHHASYHYALGTPISESDRIDWFKGQAHDLKLVGGAETARWEALGKTYDDALTDLAYAALPYWQNKLKWYEAFKPDWEMVGLDVAVFNSETETAGTPDELFWLSQRNYEKAGLKWEFGKPRALILSDDKTTNSTRVKEHAFQVAAYARGTFFGHYQDQSEHPIPDVDATCVLYMRPVAGEAVKPWLHVGEQVIDENFEIFCAANDVWRGHHDMPKASRVRKYREVKAKRGERACPIQIGGFGSVGNGQ